MVYYLISKMKGLGLRENNGLKAQKRSKRRLFYRLGTELRVQVGLMFEAFRVEGVEGLGCLGFRVSGCGLGLI